MRNHEYYTYFANLSDIHVATNSVEQSPSSRKLTVPQLVKKFPEIFGTRRFNTAFTTARHLSLSPSLIDPIHIFKYCSSKATLILSSCSVRLYCRHKYMFTLWYYIQKRRHFQFFVFPYTFAFFKFALCCSAKNRHC